MQRTLARKNTHLGIKERLNRRSLYHQSLEELI
jgi:hypothetical protein